MRTMDEAARSIAAALGVKITRERDIRFRQRHGGDLSVIRSREVEAVSRLERLRRRLTSPS